MEKLAQDIMLNAFTEELEKIAHSQGLTDMEKDAFIGKAMGAMRRMFSGGGAAKATKAVRPAVTSGAPRGVGKALQSSGQTFRGSPSVMRTQRTGGFQATRGGGRRTGYYTAGIPINMQKMSHVLARLREQ